MQLHQQQKPRAAAGKIETTNVNGATVVSTISYNYPLKFLVVNNRLRPHSPTWLYEVNYGGGLVSGDVININLSVGDNCHAVISGQSSMKIYKANHDSDAKQRVAEHHLVADVGRESLLCIAFPAVTCFAGSEYDQSQVVRLADETSNVIMVEWTTSGRVALGESWDFGMFQTRNEVWLCGELLIKEAMRLSDRDGPPTVRERMLPFTSMATIILVGPHVLPYGYRIHDEVSKMQIGGMGASRQQVQTLICSSSTLKFKRRCTDTENTVGVVVKVAAYTNNQITDFIRNMLSGAWSDLLGDDPYR